MPASEEPKGGVGDKRLLVVGRLLKAQGNGRREKVAEELRAFARQGFAIDCVTFEDAAPEILETYRETLQGVVDRWFVWRDPFLGLVRTVRRLLRGRRGEGSDDPGRERQRPRLRPDHPFNLLLSLPDPNAGWYLAHRRRLARLVERGGYTHLYTLSSPHSVHLAGLYTKRRHPGLDWTLSFRDPWTTYPLQHPARWVTAFNRRLERRCLEACTRAVIYSGWAPGGREAYHRLFGDRLAGKVVESPYIGCDEARIDRILADRRATGHDGLRFVHLGTLYGHDHSPVPFLRALAAYLARDDRAAVDIRVAFLGGITEDAARLIREEPLLRECVEVTPYLAYTEAIRRAADADVALWFQAEQAHFAENIPAKVFEYVYLRLPVLAVSAADDGFRVLDERGAGRTVAAHDGGAIADAIGGYAEMRARGKSVRLERGDLFPRAEFVQWFGQAVVAAAGRPG